jgi:hypothetical protein
VGGQRLGVPGEPWKDRFGVVAVLRGDVYGVVGGRSTRDGEDER